MLDDGDIQQWLAELKAVKLSESGLSLKVESEVPITLSKATGGSLDDAKVSMATTNLAHSRKIDEAGDVMAKILETEKENIELREKLNSQAAAQSKVFGYLQAKLLEGEQTLRVAETVDMKARRRVSIASGDYKRRLNHVTAKHEEEVQSIHAHTADIRSEVEELRRFEQTIPQLEAREKELQAAIEKGRRKHRTSVEVHAKKAEEVRTQLSSQRHAEIEATKFRATVDIQLRLGDKTKALIKRNNIVSAELGQQSDSASMLSARVESIERANREIRQRLIEARGAGERVAKHFVSHQRELRSTQYEAMRHEGKMAAAQGSVTYQGGNASDGGGNGWEMLTQGGGATLEALLSRAEASVLKLRAEVAEAERSAAVFHEQMHRSESDLTHAVEHQDEFVRVVLGSVQEHLDKRRDGLAPHYSDNFESTLDGSTSIDTMRSTASILALPSPGQESAPPPLSRPQQQNKMNQAFPGERQRREVLALILERLHRNQVEHRNSLQEHEKAQLYQDQPPITKGASALPSIWPGNAL